MKEIRDWIKWYMNQGINLIPLRKQEKVPLITWGEFKKRKTTEKEVEKWLARGITNFAVICGSISNGLLVIDVDKEELFSKLNLEELASETFTVKTGKGYHIYLRIPDEKTYPKKKDLMWRDQEEIRFQREGRYVVCAGSIHPSGVRYEQYRSSPQEIKIAKPELLDEIERRWRKYHGIDKLEEKGEEIKLKTKRSGLIEDFKRRVSLTDVVARYVSKVSDYGAYWRGHCPFHEDVSPSFVVYEERRSYHCFGCGEWGDVIAFIRKSEKRDFFDAIRRIEELTGVEYFRGEKRKGERRTTTNTKDRAKPEGAKVTVDERTNYPYPIEVEELIASERDFVTLRDTEEVLHYENTRGGAWRFNGEAVIKEETEKILKVLGKLDKVTRYFVSEVIGHVQRSTYIDREVLNTEKWKINLLNGVYDLETEQLLPHDSGYYFTYLIPVQYNTEADCKKIKKFLGEILPEDDVKTVLQYIGYCMLPIMPYHQAMMLLGEGANGKSTLIELVRRFLGEKNTSSHSLQSIIEDRFTKAGLYGRLANLYADISKDALRKTGVFKVLTGGDTLSVEKKFKDFFEFKNTTKLIFSANVLPYTYDDTEAFFRRWLIINFPNKFEGEQCDPKILEKLTVPEELSGFLNLVLLALKRLLKEGRFHKSKVAAEIREEYIDKSDSVLSFVSKCLELNQNSYERKDKVYSAFIKFCGEGKLPDVSKQKFGSLLPRYAQVREERKRILGKITRCWQGIRLKGKEEEEEVTSEQEVSDEATVYYACKGCGARFKDYIELKKHQPNCIDSQERQVREAAEEKE